MPARKDHSGPWFQSPPSSCPTKRWRCSPVQSTPAQPPACFSTRTTTGAGASCSNWTTCSSWAPSSGAATDQPALGMPFQVGDPLLDQAAMPFPFDEGLMQELNEPLGLPGIMTAGLQVVQ